MNKLGSSLPVLFLTHTHISWRLRRRCLKRGSWLFAWRHWRFRDGIMSLIWRTLSRFRKPASSIHQTFNTRGCI